MLIQTFLLFGATMGIADDYLPERLLVDAQAAIVDIDPISNNRQLINLPMLQFPLAIEPGYGQSKRNQGNHTRANPNRRQRAEL